MKSRLVPMLESMDRSKEMPEDVAAEFNRIATELETPEFLEGAELECAQNAVITALNDLFEHENYQTSFRMLMNHVFVKKYQWYQCCSLYALPGEISIAFWPGDFQEFYEIAIESLIHEVLHQVITLEECVHSIFVDRQIRYGTDKLGMRGALSGKPKTFNESFQSCLVASALSEYWLSKGDMEKAKRHLKKLKPVYSDLHQLVQRSQEESPLLSPRGLELLQDLGKTIQWLDEQLTPVIAKVG